MSLEHFMLAKPNYLFVLIGFRSEFGAVGGLVNHGFTSQTRNCQWVILDVGGCTDENPTVQVSELWSLIV